MRRSLLLPYPALALVMGLAYILGSPERTISPSFGAARSIAPLEYWGLLFLAGAAFLTAALVIGGRTLMSFGLFVGGVIYTWWACLFAIAALTDPRASLTGWAIFGVVAFGHYLSAWRVRSGEGL